MDPGAGASRLRLANSLTGAFEKIAGVLCGSARGGRRVPGFQGSRVPRLQVAGLQGCRVAGFQGCRVPGFQACKLAGLQGPKGGHGVSCTKKFAVSEKGFGKKNDRVLCGGKGKKRVG